MNEYFSFWVMHLGYNFRDKHTGRPLTKGEFYRLHTNIAEALATGEPLPDRFQLVERPPFVPFVEQHGKRKEKAFFENNKILQNGTSER